LSAARACWRTGSIGLLQQAAFLANRGSKRDRLAAVCDAVAEVYASTFSPDPIEYRAERGLLDLHEEMGIMIQEVVGMQVGRYYLPAFGGVAFSNNEFRWSPRISREDGLVRLPGLGPAPSTASATIIRPASRPARITLKVTAEGSCGTPRRVISSALPTGSPPCSSPTCSSVGSKAPMFKQVFSAVDANKPTQSAASTGTAARQPVATFEGLASSSPFLAQMRSAVLRGRSAAGGHQVRPRRTDLCCCSAARSRPRRTPRR
jgi:hypothetical protein